MPVPTVLTIGRELLVGTRDLVFGLACAGCGAAGQLLCEGCAEPLGRPARPASPTPRPAGLPDVWAVCAYDGPVRAAVNAYKEHARLGLAPPLGKALAAAVGAAIADRRYINERPQRYVLVGVPSSPSTVRDRGHDATGQLARVAAAHLRKNGVDVVTASMLKVGRRVADQAGLSIDERRANVAGALQVRPGRERLLGGRHIVVVDDVMTTGSTLLEVRRAIECTGLPAPTAAVVAATQRRAATRGAQERLA